MKQGECERWPRWLFNVTLKVRLNLHPFSVPGPLHHHQISTRQGGNVMPAVKLHIDHIAEPFLAAFYMYHFRLELVCRTPKGCYSPQREVKLVSEVSKQHPILYHLVVYPDKIKNTMFIMH
jgi:hypothetical protein